MKKTKKLVMWLLMLALVFSLTACGEEKDADEDKDDDKRTESVQEEDDKDEVKEDSKEESKEDEKITEDTETIGKADPVATAEPEATEAPKATEEPEATEEPAKEVIAGAMTAKEMLMQEKDAVDTSAKMIMDVEVALSMQGMTMDLLLTMDGVTMNTEDPYMVYADMDMKLNMMGEEQAIKTTTYTVEEDGEIYTYTGTSETGWSKTATGMKLEDVLSTEQYNFGAFESIPDEQFELEAATQVVNDKEVYKINVLFTGQNFVDLIADMGGNIEELDTAMEEIESMGIDMSVISAECAYYVDVENYRIVKVDMTLLGLDKLFDDIMALAMAEGGEDMAEMDMKLEVRKCAISYDFLSYGDVEIPAMPDAALNAELVEY